MLTFLTKELEELCWEIVLKIFNTSYKSNATAYSINFFLLNRRFGRWNAGSRLERSWKLADRPIFNSSSEDQCHHCCRPQMLLCLDAITILASLFGLDFSGDIFHRHCKLIKRVVNNGKLEMGSWTKSLESYISWEGNSYEIGISMKNATFCIVETSPFPVGFYSTLCFGKIVPPMNIL